jgi:putative thioredoxin
MDAPLSADPIKTGTDASFMTDVVEASRNQPVIVDFWAPWCGPCKQLAPALEKTVRAAKGAVRLVKINIDENPAMAGQMGVRSIPAVYAFDGGRPVDGFMGLIPESQIKLFVDRLAGADASAGIEEMIAQAQESLKLGDIGGAAQGFAGALSLDPENAKAIAGLARCYLAGGDHERAAETLALAAPEKATDPDIVGVRTALELAANAPTADAAPLLARLEANPNDHEARFALANDLAARGRMADAVDQLLTIVEKDRAWNDEAARKQALKIFEAEGWASEVSKSGRRRLSAILFS